MIRWRQSAVDAAYDIAAYIARESPSRADRFLVRLWDTVDLLEAWPGIGKPRRLKSLPMFNAFTHAVMSHPNHSILYFRHPDGIEVIDVFHAAQDPRRRFTKV